MSELLIIRDFHFLRDFRQIKWGVTLWYNLLRAICAGLVLGILMFIFPSEPNARISALLMPITWPFVYLIVFIPIGILCSILKNIPFVNYFSMFIALISVAIGDPIVCVLYKLIPETVPVESPSLLSFVPIFWVVDAPEIVIAS
jgi:hypothetical protein